MESKNVVLRKFLNASLLKFHIKRFFKLTKFTSNYIYIQTKLGEVTYDIPKNSLGGYFAINLNNKGEKTYYINHLINQFKIEYSKEVEINKIKIISISFISTNQKEYESFLIEMSQKNPFK